MTASLSKPLGWYSTCSRASLATDAKTTGIRRAGSKSGAGSWQILINECTSTAFRQSFAPPLSIRISFGDGHAWVLNKLPDLMITGSLITPSYSVAAVLTRFESIELSMFSYCC
jgi:hypothetical protein